MLKTWTEPVPKPERDANRRELRRAKRLCYGLTASLIREDWKRYKRWKTLHADHYELQEDVCGQ